MNRFTDLRAQKHALFLVLLLGLIPMAFHGCSDPTQQPLDQVVEELDFQSILYVKRKTYVSDHFYTDFINGVGANHLDPANGIYRLDLDTDVETPIITAAQLPNGQGVVGRFALSFDAQRIVFDYKPDIDSGFRIWEVNIDGTGLRQLTFDPPNEAERIARYSLEGFEEFEVEEPADPVDPGECTENNCFPLEMAAELCFEEQGEIDECLELETQAETCFDEYGDACEEVWLESCLGAPNCLVQEMEVERCFNTRDDETCDQLEINNETCWSSWGFCEDYWFETCLEDPTCRAELEATWPDEFVEGELDEDGEEYNEQWYEGVSYNHHTDDMHPAYAPDGSILFTSTRAEYTVLCDSDGFLTVPVIHRISADGEGMEQLTRSPVSEFAPVALPNGRIMYTRWEYIDKGSVCVKGIWSMNPDGTASEEMFGNNHSTPATLNFGRAVPGRPDLFVTVGCPHYPQGGCVGTLMLIDTNRDIRTTDPITSLTPNVQQLQEEGWHFDGQHSGDGRGGMLYTDPFPIREGLYLISVKDSADALWNDPQAYSIQFLDDGGVHTPIRDDENFSLFVPTPLRSVPTPVVINPVRHPDFAKNNEALLIVTDVEAGMEGVAPGTIRYLRINEAVSRPWSSQRFQNGSPLWQPYVTSTGWHGALWVRVQWGIVPVEEDGSAFFTVPADRNIFFQALDENYMEVQRERTYINFRPGEIRSCIGCHERTGSAPGFIEGEVPMALSRAADLAGSERG